MVVGEEGAWELREVDTGRVIDTFVTRGEAEERAKNSGGRLQVAQTHHSTLVQGENVSGAGTIKIERGKVTQISNISGHYMPRFEHLLQTVESLLQSGVILNKELVDYQGRKAEEISPDVKKVFKAVQPRLAELPKDKARVMDIIKDLNSGTLDSDDTEDLESELDKITERVSLVDRAVTALRKMGIGPRNKIRDVDTTFIYAEKAQTGAEFVMSEQKEKMTAQELLMGKQTKKAPPKEEIDVSNLGANSYVISEQGNVFGDGRVEEKGNEPTPSELREQEKRKNFRNADPKRAMQDELMDVARQKKLRPEDRDPIPVDPKKPEGEKIKTVFEGTSRGSTRRNGRKRFPTSPRNSSRRRRRTRRRSRSVTMTTSRLTRTAWSASPTRTSQATSIWFPSRKPSAFVPSSDPRTVAMTMTTTRNSRSTTRVSSGCLTPKSRAISRWSLLMRPRRCVVRRRPVSVSRTTMMTRKMTTTSR